MSNALQILMDFAWVLLQSLFVLLPLLISVAYLVYAERKIIGAIQLRKGPSVVGPLGLLQPIADAIKLIHKETILPTRANPILYMVAPIVTFTLSLMVWAVIPWGSGMVMADINLGILYVFAISSLGVYGIVIAGWASNSQYAFLGAMRSAAQMISYELSIGLIFVSVIMCTGSLNLTDIVMAQQKMWLIIPLFPMGILFLIAILAETNRAPFDLPEAEAELVAGYNVEYSSMSFGMFFLGEYANMILMSAMMALLFLGGWLPPCDNWFCNMIPGFVWMAGKISLVLFVFLWVRATFPRYRYDQLMRIGWKFMLPMTLLFIVIQAFILFFLAPDFIPGAALEALS